ncbi:MAG: hypothetical protein JWM65_392 [Sphingomonas bacterium]|nr:hypothetical protein [Sphingomonas bacterium]
MNAARSLYLSCTLIVVMASCATAAPDPQAAADLERPKSVPTTQGAPEEQLPDIAVPGIAMEIRVWGHLIAAFDVRGSGDVEYREAKRAGDGDYDIVVKRFHITAADFARLSSMIAPIRERVKSGAIDCGSVPPDGPYARFRWHLTASDGDVSLQYGCQREGGRQTLAMIDAVEKIVIDWSASVPITRVQQITRSPG